jgi:hypothetical protein
MPANPLFKNRLKAYEARERKAKSQPIPPGFGLCPVGVVSHIGTQQIASIQQIYAQAYESARRNVIPFYLRPVLGTGN